MQRTKRSGSRFGVIFAIIVAFGLGILTTTAVMARQPHMYAARSDLRSAYAELQAATPDKGGHRDNAMGLINQAIGQVNAGIAYAH